MASLKELLHDGNDELLNEAVSKVRESESASFKMLLDDGCDDVFHGIPATDEVIREFDEGCVCTDLYNIQPGIAKEPTRADALEYKKLKAKVRLRDSKSM